MEADSHCSLALLPRSLDVPALKRARQYLDTQKTRIVHSSELEAVTGLTRYELARQFRAMCGTCQQIAEGRSLVEVAIEAGFADQAHFSRMFKATFGITPARYRALRSPERSEDAIAKERSGMSPG